MTKIIRPDDTLNIYYRVSENTKEIENIVRVEKDGEEVENISNLKNVQMIQWSPDKTEHNNQTFKFDISGLGTQKIRIAELPYSIDYRWRFDENAGNTLSDSISDLDANKNELNWDETNGGTGGVSLYSNGSDSPVAGISSSNLPPALSDTTFSACVWFKGTSTSTNYPFTRHPNSPDGWYISPRNGDELQITFTTTTGRHNLNPSNVNDYTDNDWYHYGFSYDGEMLRAYFNGSNVAEMDVTGEMRDIDNTDLAFGDWDDMSGTNGVREMNIDDPMISVTETWREEEFNMIFESTKEFHGY